jgi:catechol 2,3-dioxygenase-like lactoylglutathione lyase family enzyme
MIKARGVNHVALRISDVARASEFYGKLLGLEVVPFPAMDREQAAKFRDEVASSKGVARPTGGIWFAAGNTQLHLIATSGHTERSGSPFGPRLALEVEDFDETRRTLQGAGIEFLEAPSRQGAGRQIWISDPDGNTVELRAEK